MKTVAMRWVSGVFDARTSPRLSGQSAASVKTLGGPLGAPPEREGFVLAEPRMLLGRLRARCAEHAANRRVGLTMHAAARSAHIRPHAFTMAMSELLENAIDASAPHQEVVVLVSETGDGDLLWQVQDDGIGMTAHELDAVGASAAGNGRSLGIARARAVVEAHRGLIHFESTPMFGTTASVWLPQPGRAVGPTRMAAPNGAGEEFALSSRGPGSRPREQRRGRILIVDDDPLLRETFAQILGAYEVTLASNGKDALVLAVARGFDAIVSDLMMPEMTGMQLFAALQLEAPDQATRMCFVTGGGAQTEEFLASVANPRLYKPFAGAELLAAVGELAVGNHHAGDQLHRIARPPNRFR